MRSKSKSAKIAQLSDCELQSSDDGKPSAKQALSSRVKFSRSAKSFTYASSDHVTYNADTGCTDTLVMSHDSVKASSPIPPTPIYMADDNSIKATAIGPIQPPITLPPVPGLVALGLAENLLSIGQLADNGVTSIFTKNKVKFF